MQQRIEGVEVLSLSKNEVDYIMGCACNVHSCGVDFYADVEPIEAQYGASCIVDSCGVDIGYVNMGCYVD